MTVVTVKLDPELLDDVDRAVREFLKTDRSKFVRAALRWFLPAVRAPGGSALLAEPPPRRVDDTPEMRDSSIRRASEAADAVRDVEAEVAAHLEAERLARLEIDRLERERARLERERLARVPPDVLDMADPARDPARDRLGIRKVGKAKRKAKEA